MTKTLLFLTLMLVAPVAVAEEQYTLTMSNAIGFIPSSSEYTCRIDDRNLKINCLNHKDSKGNYQQRKKAVSKKEKPDLLEITIPGTCNEEYPCMCASPNKKCSCLCYFKNNEKLFINCHSECFEVQPAEEAKPEVLTESEAFERLDRTGNLSDTIIVKDNCPKIDCGLNNPSGKMCTFDKNGCAVYVEQSDAEPDPIVENWCQANCSLYKPVEQSDAEKWREECDSKIASIKSFQEYGLKISSDSWAEVNVYCTRALIEEMRNN